MQCPPCTAAWTEWRSETQAVPTGKW
jgi:hypothetical protein